MFLKLIGSILVITASSLLGFIISSDYGRRPSQLRTIKTMLQVFENEICFMSSILHEALEKAGKAGDNEAALIFTRASENMRKGTFSSTERAWAEAVKYCMPRTALDKEDEEILVSFGKILGTTDIEGQVKNIRLLISHLEIQEKKAEESRKRNEALFRNLGILGGFAIVIILF